jgi:pyruvate,water dikinase
MTRLLSGTAQAGSVPPGFVITAQVFDLFLRENNLAEKIQLALNQTNPQNTDAVEKISKKIRSLIESSPTPPALANEFVEIYTQLASEFVAVRSSATAEDSNTASWAGELESYLFTTQETLLENIKKCWSSLFTPRAIFYRFEKNLQKEKVSVAVVVQKMVKSNISGIIFTVHPVTKDPNQLIIEAAWGLGEAIAGGMVTPDSYVVDKRDWSIIDIYQADQDFKVAFKPGGGSYEICLDDNEKGQKLTGKQIIEIAKLAKKIEEHYNMPMDIEFAIEDNTVYIVQARPITTL